MSDPDILFSKFGPLSLCFKYHIMAHIIPTTLIPRKRSLRNITYHDVFVLSYMVKKHKINGATCIRTYMLESAANVHASASLPYGLLITHILFYYSIDLSTYPSVEVSSTYYSNTFANTIYVLVDNESCKKDSARAKFELPKISKSISNPMITILKELEDLKDHFKAIKEGVMLFQESTSNMSDLGKSIRTNRGSVWLAFDGFK
ncbi:hypothetical protein FXO37_23782 [Capsicum annuum]|nr:hypothetical protein FXO37_23782 [Capsicum annuum]